MIVFHESKSNFLKCESHFITLARDSNRPKKLENAAGSELISLIFTTHLHDDAPGKISTILSDETLKHGSPHISANALTMFLVPPNCLHTENSTFLIHDARANKASSSESVNGPISALDINSFQLLSTSNPATINNATQYKILIANRRVWCLINSI